MCRRVEVASPAGLGPSFRIAIARIAAAGGAFTFEDEVDPTKFARGVTDARRAWSSARAMARLLCHCCLEAGRASARQSCRLICGAHGQNSAASAGARVAALAHLTRDGLSGYLAAAAWPREARVRFGTIGGSSSPRCAFSSAPRPSRLSSGSGSSAPGASPASSPVSSDPSSLSR